MSAMVQSFDDDQLSKLQSLVYQESQKRLTARIDAGDIAPLIDDEKTLAEDNKINAIMTYQKRTGEALYVAKAVVERFFEKR